MGAKLGDITVRVFLLAWWLGGLLVALFGDDSTNRIVGALIWLGVGAGWRLSEIEQTLKTRMPPRP